MTNLKKLKQAVLVVSCAPEKMIPGKLIQEVMELDGTPESEVISIGHQEITLYPWHIVTKYYEADIHFVELKDRDIVSEQFCDAVQAVVIYFDNHDETSFKSIDTWKPFVSEFDPEIKILVCKTAEDTAPVPKLTVQKWCIDNGFELVETDPLEERDDSDLEDDFIESKSVRRIMQALHAHPWSHLELKNVPEYKPSSKFQELLANESAGNGMQELLLSEERRDETAARVDSLLEDNKQVFEQLDHENGDFENLFDKFVDMKEKAAVLTGEERKLFAEKTALAFYKALGGSDDDTDQE